MWKQNLEATKSLSLVLFPFVDKKEQQQLLAIVNVNSAVDDDEKEGLKRAMGDFWGENS